MATLPIEGEVVEITVSGPPSGSESLASTAMLTALPERTLDVSATATGGFICGGVT
jgi:hypothetical protein